MVGCCYAKTSAPTIVFSGGGDIDDTYGSMGWRDNRLLSVYLSSCSTLAARKCLSVIATSTPSQAKPSQCLFSICGVFDTVKRSPLMYDRPVNQLKRTSLST